MGAAEADAGGARSAAGTTRARSQSASTETHDLVFLFDVDDTLLDNDRVIADFTASSSGRSARTAQSEYFAILEEQRGQLGYVDYLGALQRYRTVLPLDSHVLAVSPY